jgi:hypothetical protein
LLRAKFPQPATAARWAMPSGDPEAAVLVVGFADGVVRLLQRSVTPLRTTLERRVLKDTRLLVP